MPTFRDINRFNPVQTVDPNSKIQISATEFVTLQQIANLAPGATGNNIKLDGYSIKAGNSNPTSLSPSSTVTYAFQKIMEALGAGYIDSASKIAVISEKLENKTNPDHIFRLLNTLQGNHCFSLVMDTDNQIFGLAGTGSPATLPSSQMESAFSFKINQWEVISDVATLYPNQIHTAGSTVAVALTKSNWDKVNIGSAAIIVNRDTSKTLSSIVNTLVSTVKSSYTVYIPTLDQFELLDTSTTNDHMILVQKLGTYFFITVSPMVKA